MDIFDLGCGFVAIVLLIAFFVVMGGATEKGVDAAKAQYDSSKNMLTEQVYKDYYERSFNAAEAKNHVSNRTSITIGSLQEKAELVVFEASDVEYVTDNYGVADDKTVSWLKVKGTGKFSVNLKTAEFLIDDARNSVTVRIHKPKLTVVYGTEPEQMAFKDGTINAEILWTKVELNNGEAAQGVDLAMTQYNEGRGLVENAIKSNATLNKSAEKAAENMLTNLIKSLNTDNSELTVNVEFF